MTYQHKLALAVKTAVVAALMSGSVLAILAGLVLYVRPLLYIKAINSAVGLVSATFEGKAVAGSNKGLVFAG